MSGRDASALERLLAARDVVIACGPGGVGKTTTAAALATAAAARARGRVLVLTVDPARRLADALGVGGLADEPRRVPRAAFSAAGLSCKGELWAAMLDTKQSWDALVRRHAPSASAAAEILANPLYQNITGRFAQSHEYIAMERLYELHALGRFDLLVVDTPPSRNALDFLDAPDRMADFFSSGLLRWLIAPYRSRLVSLASRPFSQIADRILGSQFVEDIAQFFILFQAMYDGFVERARAVRALVHGEQTTFMVVTTLEAVPALEARRFVEALEARNLRLGLLVANKVLPPAFADPAALRAAQLLGEHAGTLADAVVARAGDARLEADLLERVLGEVARSFVDYRSVANLEAELLAELGQAHEVTATVAHQAGDVVDLAGLAAMGDRLFDGLARGA